MINEFVVFDLETTGTDTVTDRIVQISARKFSRDLFPVDEPRTLLINPLMKIPEAASAVHGITDEMVANKPTFASYAKAMYEYFAGCAVLGYNNAGFDVPLLNQEFRRVGIYWPTNEPIIDAFKIMQIKEPRTLAGAVKFYTGEVFADGHDAGRDVEATKKVFFAQLQQYEDLRGMDLHDLELFCYGGKPRVDVAGKFARNEQGVIVYNFGKDIGKSVKENPGFGMWMQKQPFPTDTLAILENIFKGTMK